MSRNDEQPHRPHPLMGSCLVVFVCGKDRPGHVGFAGEVIDIVRTSARYGDALFVEGFPRRDGKPAACRLISISEIAAVREEVQVLIFDGPFAAAEWFKAYEPLAFERYELDFEPCDDGCPL